VGYVKREARKVFIHEALCFAPEKTNKFLWSVRGIGATVLRRGGGKEKRRACFVARVRKTNTGRRRTKRGNKKRLRVRNPSGVSVSNPEPPKTPLCAKTRRGQRG